jgi:hypothetical protein
MAIGNFSDTTPAPPEGTTNCLWQGDGLTPRNMSVYMPVMIGDDDPSSPLAASTSGAVPAPPVGSAAAGAYLKADGAFEVPAGAAITVNGTPTVKVNGAAVSYSSQVQVNGV